MLVLTLLGITEQKVQTLITSLLSAFPTSLVDPLCCSFPLSWRQNPYGQFLWDPFLCLLCLPHVVNYFKADRPEWCSLVLSDLLCPSSSLFQQLLHSSPYHIWCSPEPGHPSLLNHLSSQLLPRSIWRSPKGSWSLSSEREVFKSIWSARCLMCCGLQEMKRNSMFLFLVCYSNPQLIITNNRWKCVWYIS